MVLLLIPVLFLVASLIRVSEQDVTISLVMEDELVDDTLGHVGALLPRELGKVMGSLRVVRGEDLELDFVTLLCGELFLVVAGHVVVFLTEEILVVLKIISIIFFDLAAGRTLLSGASACGRHSLVFRNLNYTGFPPILLTFQYPTGFWGFGVLGFWCFFDASF